MFKVEEHLEGDETIVFQSKKSKTSIVLLSIIILSISVLFIFQYTLEFPDFNSYITYISALFMLFSMWFIIFFLFTTANSKLVITERRVLILNGFTLRKVKISDIIGYEYFSLGRQDFTFELKNGKTCRCTLIINRNSLPILLEVLTKNIPPFKMNNEIKLNDTIPCDIDTINIYNWVYYAAIPAAICLIMLLLQICGVNRMG